MTEVNVGYSHLQARINRSAVPQTVQSATVRTASVDNYSAAPTYAYSLTSGNPRRLTVGQVVQEVYKIDPQKDAARYQSLVDQVVRLNGLVLPNFPLPGTLTSLKMPAPPTQSNDLAKNIQTATQAVTAIEGIVNVIKGKSDSNLQVPAQSGQGTLTVPQTQPRQYANGDTKKVVQGIDQVGALADSIGKIVSSNGNNSDQFSKITQQYVPAAKEAASLIDGLIGLFK